MYNRIHTNETYKVDAEGNTQGRAVYYFDYAAVVTQILDMVEAANIPGLRPGLVDSYRRDVEEGAGAMHRLGMYFEYEPAFGCGATLNINISAWDTIETRDGTARKVELACQIGTGGTNRDLAGTMLFANILQQVITLAASIEAQFSGNDILSFVK